MQGVQAKKVLGYMVLPGIIPRTKSLFASGFGYLAFLMASIYNIVRLLPSNHPYLESRNIGKYGIRHVIGEAANNLVLSRKNIDQLIIFVALLIGIIILVMQLVILAYGYVIAPALAQSIFGSPTVGYNVEQDIAFMMLDRVFGIPGFFGSCIDVGTVCRDTGPDGIPFPAEPGNLPHAFHYGLQSLFRFYSMGILIVAALIFMYFVIIIIGETAVTGTPFGQRFQNVWVPIRLVVALGLLIPISHGLNTGQYITLYAAKSGSNLATNGWLAFNNSLGEQGQTGNNDALVALPEAPSLSPTISFMSVVQACAYSYWHHSKNKAATPTGAQVDYYIAPHQLVRAYFVKNPFVNASNPSPFQEVTDGTEYSEALAFYDNSDIIIRFGLRDENNDNFKKYKGHIEPTCGEIRIAISDVSDDGETGPGAMQEFYYNMVKDMWFSGGDSTNNIIQAAQRYMAVEFNDQWNRADGTPYYASCTICNNGANHPLGCNTVINWNIAAPPPFCTFRQPDKAIKAEIKNAYNDDLETHVDLTWNQYRQVAASYAKDPNVTKRGWASAGIWYNRINAVNGGFIGSVRNIPAPVSYPLIMEQVKQIKISHDSKPFDTDQYEPNLKGEQKIELSDNTHGRSTALEIAKGLNNYYKFWNSDVFGDTDQDKVKTGSLFSDIVNFAFGTSGLMAMRGDNSYIHPLAQLTAVGKSLVDSAVVNLLGSTTGVISAILGSIPGIQGDAAAKFSTSIAFVALTAGFVLFYVLPFLPFVYFFFAVGSWVKTIFEAMVGVPLWALAHLRIDGEGLPGDSATNGYFLIFEIFLRPILTVIALIASVTIFTAQVRVLHGIWPLVLDNLTGHGDQYDTTILNVETFDIVIKRDTIDQFFFTILYTTIVYMLATASFKLIDKIPDQILRWAGGGVSSFSDINEDATGQLTRYAAVGGLTFGRQLTTSAQQMGQGVGNIVKSETGKLSELMEQMSKSKI